MNNPKDIGHIDCPCCGEPAAVRVSEKNQRAYTMCNSAVCGYQGFTRSADADKKLREKMRPIQQQAAAAAAEQPKKGSWLDGI